jgi:hypothetical protein
MYNLLSYFLHREVSFVKIKEAFNVTHFKLQYKFNENYFLVCILQLSFVQREAGNVAWQQGDLTTALVNYSR